MTRTFHLGLSVRGALHNCSWMAAPPDEDVVSMVGMCTHEGRQLTSDEIFDRLCDELAEGHEVIPVGECDSWDWKDGCQGHEKKEVAP